MTPTAEQLAIVEAAKSTTDNLIVHAYAGAAKTTTLVLIAKALPQVPIFCIAFNKKIASEMSTRLPTNCTAKTLNSIGHQAWSAAIGKRLNLSTDKTYDIYKQLELPWDQYADTTLAVRLAKAAGYVPPEIKTGKSLIDPDHFFEQLDDDADREAVNAILAESIRQSWSGVIDFDDQLYMPTLFSGVFPKPQLLLVDEAQDLSPLNHKMLDRMVQKRIIAVGDPCQPDGTLVTKVIKAADRWNKPQLEQVPIENINVGDTVLGYNGVGAFLFNRKIEGITRKLYNGPLVSVTAGANHSRYTPNHHCYASFERLRDKHVLYLMQKGSVFRMGISKMDYPGIAPGPIARARHEEADALWLLETYDTAAEARLNEAYYQVKFGIPDLTFLEPDSNQDRGFLREFWGMVESLDLESRAAECLAYFGRDIKYPLWENSMEYMTLKRPIVVRACNLMTGCTVLPYKGNSKINQSSWVEIEVGMEHYEGQVTSFTVSDNQLYVADNIVTHNCQAIYGFRGADEDSMSNLELQFDMRRMKLSTTFRCARSITERARWRAPDINCPETAAQGHVEHLNHLAIPAIQPGAAIICRKNAPLIRLAFQLIRAGRGPKFLGFDIGPGLIKVLKKLGPASTSRDEALIALAKWNAGRKQSKTQRERYECLKIILEEASDLGFAIVRAEQIFNAEGQILLMSGHKSKGLEFDTVYHLNPSDYGEGRQEANIRYVIETRAKHNLYLIEADNVSDH